MPIKRPKAPKPTAFDPKAYAALQIEFEAKDRAIFLRIAQAFESMAISLDKIASNPSKATTLNPSVTEVPKQ